MSEPTVVDHAALTIAFNDLLSGVVVDADRERRARHLHALLSNELDEELAFLERYDLVLAALLRCIASTFNAANCFFWDLMALLFGLLVTHEQQV